MFERNEIINNIVYHDIFKGNLSEYASIIANKEYQIKELYNGCSGFVHKGEIIGNRLEYNTPSQNLALLGELAFKELFNGSNIPVIKLQEDINKAFDLRIADYLINYDSSQFLIEVKSKNKLLNYKHQKAFFLDVNELKSFKQNYSYNKNYRIIFYYQGEFYMVDARNLLNYLKSIETIKDYQKLYFIRLPFSMVLKIQNIQQIFKYKKIKIDADFLEVNQNVLNKLASGCAGEWSCETKYYKKMSLY